MNKRLLYRSIVAGVVFCLLFGSTSIADDLIAFDRAKIAAAKEAFEIRVIAKLDKFAIALFQNGDIEKLKKFDNLARLIEQSTDIELLWLKDY